VTVLNLFVCESVYFEPEQNLSLEAGEKSLASAIVEEVVQNRDVLEGRRGDWFAGICVILDFILALKQGALFLFGPAE